MMPGLNLIKPVSIQTLISTEKSCLTEISNQPKIYKVATGAPLVLCLANKFAKSSIFCLTALNEIWP